MPCSSGSSKSCVVSSLLEILRWMIWSNAVKQSATEAATWNTTDAAMMIVLMSVTSNLVDLSEICGSRCQWLFKLSSRNEIEQDPDVSSWVFVDAKNGAVICTPVFCFKDNLVRLGPCNRRMIQKFLDWSRAESLPATSNVQNRVDE